jgi:hypothetical protein
MHVSLQVTVKKGTQKKMGVVNKQERKKDGKAQ